MSLPTFKYHPDPLATGSVVASDVECACCGQARGHVYAGPVYAEGDYENRICPWCIADGSAHRRLGASFTDEEAVGGYGDWPAVSEAVVEEVAYRTPGFSGWQQENWWTHCGDAGEYLGRAGKLDLKTRWPQAIESIRQSAGLEDGTGWAGFFDALDKDGSPTAYVFRCRHCGALGGYQDCD